MDVKRTMRKRASVGKSRAIQLPGAQADWLLLLFSLPTKRTSERVEVWRRLKRIGALPLGTSGYLLPNTASNQEHFAWLATNIHAYKGEASVIQVHAIDGLSPQAIAERFNAARSADYQELMDEVSKMQKAKRFGGLHMASARRRLDAISAIDFFDCALRKPAEDSILGSKGLLPKAPSPKLRARAAKASGFRNRTWVTRPRPGIDRVSSAWLIKKFIDHGAKFAFAKRAAELRGAVPFDMFEGKGFSHVGDDCTFETLCKEFAIRDPKVLVIAEMVHDADLQDEKFGRSEAIVFESVLHGWAQEGITDRVLLERGMSLFEGFFRSLGSVLR